VVRRLLAIGVLLLAVTACSEPPQKEIDQAQAALDLAHGAGADRFAAEDYTAAVTALQKAHDAVDQRDYRQALSYAIDARRRAQEASRQAADGRKRAQKTVETLYGEVATRANRLQSLLRDAETARPKPKDKDLIAPRTTLAETRTALQEASTAITLGNYEQGSKSVTGVRGKLDAAIKDLENIPLRSPRSARIR
jgi:Domain of unknown function (DUF4398)